MSAWSPPAAEKRTCREGRRGRGSAKWDRDRGSRSGVRQEVFLDVVAVGLEQHAGAAKLTNLLLGPLDHAVALAGVGRHHFAGGSHLEALFLRLTWSSAWAFS